LHLDEVVFSNGRNGRWLGECCSHLSNQNGDLFANFEIGRQNLANHAVSNWLDQSTSEKDRRLTAA
jgi:hypothetical protein